MYVYTPVHAHVHVYVSTAHSVHVPIWVCYLHVHVHVYYEFIAFRVCLCVFTEFLQFLLQIQDNTTIYYTNTQDIVRVHV